MKTYFYLITFCLFCVVSNGYGQKPEIENLVFEGSGIRGIAYAGALSQLENYNIVPGVKRVAGTSAGAITALLISLGYTSHEVITIISSTNFKKFNDGNFFFAGGILRLNKYLGWYKGKKFEEWLEDIISIKTGDKDITFLQMRQNGYKDLYVTGTSLDQQKLFVFSYETFPQMRIKDAVRISMSIPFYFEPVYMNRSGEVFKRRRNKENLYLMVDGGFTANFPLKIFDSTKYMRKSGQNIYAVNPKTLGFRIDSDPQIRNDIAGKGLANLPVTNLKEYSYAFFNIINENLNRQTLSREDWARSISISDGNILPRIRKLSKTELNTLIENGRIGTAYYFNKK